MINFSETLVIIPTYNEIANIQKMLEKLDLLYPELSILIIDDGSPDGTNEVVKSYQRNKKNLHLIERPGKLGLGTAYIQGFKWALDKKFKAIVTMDCDFSHDPLAIPDFTSKIGEYDLAIGSRYIGGIRIMNWPIQRLLLSYFASIYAKIISGIPFSDATGGFNCYSDRALKSLDLEKIFSIGYAFQIELKFKIWSFNLPCTEVPITFWERTKGKSKMSRKIIFEAVINVFRLRLKKLFGTL